jgi:streptomycin 6-kinase
MDDSSASVLHVVHAGRLGDDSGLLRADAELQPEGRRADRRGLTGHVRAELGPAEHVDEIHLLLERRERRPELLAERIHSQDAIADALQVARDPVTRLRRIWRRADDGDRLRVAKDLLGDSHYPHTVPDAVELAIARWREGAPAIADEVAADWGLTLGEPYSPGFCGHVVRATTADGTPAVLKIVFPDRESEQEPDALERWNGDGAIHLLGRDDERRAMLLERCEPGAFLSSLDGMQALEVLIGLLPRLWEPSAVGFHTLEDEVAYWFEERLETSRHGDVAAALARDLAPTQGELVLAHQDLHGDNVLAAEREPWLVIDPKPLAAEREFAVVPIVRSPELGHSKRDVVYRLDRLSSEFGLDRDRVRGWVIVQTVAWSGGADYFVGEHVEVVEWLL